MVRACLESGFCVAVQTVIRIFFFAYNGEVVILYGLRERLNVFIVTRNRLPSSTLPSIERLSEEIVFSISHSTKLHLKALVEGIVSTSSVKNDC